MGRGLDNEALVILQDREPRGEVAGVVRTGFPLRHDAEVGGDKSGAEFGDQLFPGALRAIFCIL